tara:strand:+ start:20317 stop:20583 length:267 start_codon:yes stop_codon:yes gene_type:complete
MKTAIESMEFGQEYRVRLSPEFTPSNLAMYLALTDRYDNKELSIADFTYIASMLFEGKEIVGTKTSDLMFRPNDCNCLFPLKFLQFTE